MLCTPSRFTSYLVDAHGAGLAVCTEDIKVATDCGIAFSYCLHDALGGDCAFAYTRDDIVAQAKTLCASDGTDNKHEGKGSTALYYILCALLAHEASHGCFQLPERVETSP